MMTVFKARTTLPNQILTSSCIALDLQDASKFGWRVLPCSTQLPILCQNYACLRGTFRCADNSKCVPASVVNDGFDDCLDGSDERTSPDASSNYLVNSATTSLSQKTHEWPLTVSSGGVLSPSTLQYGRGECTHRWTVMSPENREFAIWIEWLSPFTSTTIMIEGKDESSRIFVNSRNATSAITLTSSSFVLTASNTDTRKADFQVFYQHIDPTLCKISSDNRLSFSSEFQPSACHYQFSTNSRTSYVALLIDTCQGLTSTIAVLQFNVNSTVSLSPTPTKRLLILPTSDVSVHVSGSTWPGAETRLEIQFFELKLDGEKTLDVFLIDRQLEIEWHAKFGSGSMDGDYRTLTVNMIQTDLLDESTWKIEQFRKTCNEDSVQILSANTSQFLPTGSGLFSAIGPTTVLIRQSAQPFEFRAAFNRQPESSVSLLLKEELISVITSDTVATGKENTTICPLPPIVNGYIASVSNFSYRPYTRVITQCAPGFIPLSPIFCSQPGEWLNEGKLSLAALPLTCQVAVCQNQTIVETSLNMVPDTYDISYGTVRRYPKWELANFAPFCVCGDDNNGPNLWSCYNYLETFLENMSGACIIPQVQDAEFMRQDATTFDVFPTGYLIRMDCFLCPNLQKWYKCLNGLWYHNNTLQPYDSFQCNCAEDPDIDECVEGSDYCDQFATCHNFDGGFNCICPQDFHIYQPDNDLPHWDTIQDRLIAGYSCVESTCNGTVNLINYGVTVIEPPDMQTSIWYRSGTITPFYYATNLCNEGSQFPCVYPFFFSCIETTMFQNRDPLAACPVLDSDIYDFRILGPPYFHVFQILDVKCKNSSLTMIGRPTVFCNANLTWEALPECIEESCADPTGLVVWPLSFYTNRPKGVFTANTILFFRCELGYQLLGVENMQCTKYSDSDEIFWNKQLPTCYSESLLTTTTTSTTTNTNLPDVIYDDIVIADSVLYEETNVLEQRSNWIMSGDWTWTSSQCILHQWTFPTSFMVTSSPILLSSTEEIELSVDVRQSQCDLQVSVFSTADRHIPAISEFKRVMNSTKKCGSLVVKLKNLKGQHLAISITANGFVEICAVTIRQKACKNVEFDGLQLPSSAAFSMRRYLPASCSGSISQIVTVNGYCDSQIVYVRDVTPDGTPYCKPNHCLRTSQLRNSGYNCDTGNADYSLKCPIQNQFGSFCQFQGTLFNNSYTYVLGNGMEIAIATNVCENSETKYALPNSYCKPLMSPPTIYDGCDICAGYITHCVQSDPPFVGGAWCDCANDNEFGRSCAVSKFCFNNTDHTYRCLNGGTCNMDVGICECPIEFQGEYCQNYVGSDNCEPGEKDCVNGRCRRENEAIYCNCDDGWIKDSGGNCTIVWDFCAMNNPCQQSGQCSFNLTTGQQNCDCSLSGWKGQYCEVQPKFDDCSVCQYSQKCFDTFTGNVRCQCAVGYGGQHCAESISDCDFQPCLNNGTCNQFNYQDSLTKSVIESYNCTCPTGYSGSNCQWIINPPARNCSDFIKCENGGTCGFDKNDNAICHCTDQYFGTHCERLCSEQCAHSYGCINNGSFFCECYEGFSSKYCDVVDVINYR
uniref:Uncharacterized protein n=1 Tax=Caenorhabditis japonica TaxID=281687 RepID=A0A8R1IB21_CAEJA